jgi:hypothetical protein
MVFKKGYKQTEEHKKKISIAVAKTMKEYWKNNNGTEKQKLYFSKTNPYNRMKKERLGYVNSIETREKLSKINKGKHSSPQSEFKKGHKKGMFGKKQLDSTKKKIGIANKEHRKYQIFPIKDTSIEVKIQNFLKELKIGYFTHYYCDEILNSYQCDILIPVQKNKDRFIRQPIVIECDGDYWHSYPVGRDIDKIRTSELIEKGFRVLRLWERDIKVMDISKFKEKIIWQ